LRFLAPDLEDMSSGATRVLGEALLANFLGLSAFGILLCGFVCLLHIDFSFMHVIQKKAGKNTIGSSLPIA
jgi:hypothetical protein